MNGIKQQMPTERFGWQGLASWCVGIQGIRDYLAAVSSFSISPDLNSSLVLGSTDWTLFDN